jgi:hypothetical protein
MGSIERAAWKTSLKIWACTGACALLLISKSSWAQFEPSCERNSPERRGEIGCSLVENKPLPVGLKEPLFWHIDRFESEPAANGVVTATSAALQAHGAWWLLSVEPSVNDHHGGRHVAQIPLPALPAAANYSMLIMSAYIPSGLTSHVHHHSGVEAFFVVDGEQCLETRERIYKMTIRRSWFPANNL